MIISSTVVAPSDFGSFQKTSSISQAAEGTVPFSVLYGLMEIPVLK